MLLAVIALRDPERNPGPAAHPIPMVTRRATL
jgi:hypothetical protein